MRSWTVQNEMRDVLRRVSAGAAGWILDPANPRDKSVKVRYSEDKRAQAPR